MSIEVLDPTYDEPASEFRPAPRLARLDGMTVGIVSNGKHGTVPFFESLADELRTQHGAAEVKRIVKPNYSAPAGGDLLGQARQWHALIAGIGD